MDEIEKALRKLTETKRAEFKRLLARIESGAFANLDLKKLKGHDNLFRVRKGAYRIIFRKIGERIFILTLERRNDTTYGKYASR